MAGVPGDATKEEIEKKLLNDFRDAAAGVSENGTVVLTYAQAQVLLEKVGAEKTQ